VEKEKEMRLKKKATFYFEKEIICHVITEPKPTFLNGKFKSDLIEDWYYWFEDSRYPNEERRLFLIDIFDIKEYEAEK